MSLMTSNTADEIVRPPVPWLQTLLSKAAHSYRPDLQARADYFTVEHDGLSFYLNLANSPDPTQADLQILDAWESSVYSLSHNSAADEWSRARLTDALQETIASIFTHWGTDDPRALGSVRKTDWRVDTRCIFDNGPFGAGQGLPRRLYAVHIASIAEGFLDAGLATYTSPAEQPEPAVPTEGLHSLIHDAARRLHLTCSADAHSFYRTHGGIEMQMNLYNKQSKEANDLTLPELREWESSVVPFVNDRPEDRQSRMRLTDAITDSLREMRAHHANHSHSALSAHDCPDWQVRSDFTVEYGPPDRRGRVKKQRYYWLFIKSVNCPEQSGPST